MFRKRYDSLVQTRLHLGQGRHTWQSLSLEQLETGTAASRNVRHLVSETSLVDGSHRVAASNDSYGVTLLGGVGQHLGHLVGTRGKVGHFKDAHGTVPEERSGRKRNETHEPL